MVLDSLPRNLQRMPLVETADRRPQATLSGRCADPS